MTTITVSNSRAQNRSPDPLNELKLPARPAKEQDANTPLEKETARLIKNLGDDSFKVQECADADLRKIAPQAFPQLLKALSDPDVERSFRANEIIKASSAEIFTSFTSQGDKAVEGLKPKTERADNYIIKVWNEAKRVLHQALDGQSRGGDTRQIDKAIPQVKAMTEILSGLDAGNKQAGEILSKHLNSENEHFRIAAVSVLSRIPPNKEARAALVKTAVSDKSDFVESLARTALIPYGRDAADALVPYLKDSSTDVRKAAAKSLEELGEPGKEVLERFKKELGQETLACIIRKLRP